MRPRHIADEAPPHLRNEYTRNLLGHLDRSRFAAESERKIARVLLEAKADMPKTDNQLQGDPADLRGIPAVGRGVGGAIQGTRPEGETIRRNSR